MKVLTTELKGKFKEFSDILRAYADGKTIEIFMHECIIKEDDSKLLINWSKSVSVLPEGVSKPLIDYSKPISFSLEGYIDYSKPINIPPGSWQPIVSPEVYIEAYVNDRIKLRIKPEKKLVPFTIKDHNLFKDEWIKTKGETFLKRFCAILSDRVIIFGNDKYNEFDLIHVSYEKLLAEYEFEDGSVCGKYIEE